MAGKIDQETIFVSRVVRVFQGSRGERVEEMTICDGQTGLPITESAKDELKINEPLVRYVGVVPMVNSIPTHMGVVQIPVDTRFHIQASSPGEALSAYPARVEEIDQMLREHQKKQMEEARKKSMEDNIIVPTAGEVEAVNNSGLKLVQP
jgi:hypothetical protein